MKIIDFKNSINKEGLDEISKVINDGGLVIFPTETVYGIGADATNREAVDSIFVAKGRANDNHLIVHIADFDNLSELVYEPNEIEKKLMDAFMPGPFTIVLNKKNLIPSNVSAGLDTVGIRIPDNEIAHAIIKACGKPIAAPSANKSSRPSGTKIEDIIDEFKDSVDIIVNGGETKIGIESTVVRVIDGIPTILRPGQITPEDIEREVGICKLDEHIFQKANGVVLSPGMKYKHYAPLAKSIMIYSNNNDSLVDAINELVIANTVIIGNEKNKDKYPNAKFVSYGSTIEEISHNIFSTLRYVDELMPSLIIIEGVKRKGLGIAVMNRLIRSCDYNYKEI